MIQVFKIINGIDDMNCEFFFEFTDYDGTKNSNNKLYSQYARTQSKKCTFSGRSTTVWNTKLSQLTKCIIIINIITKLSQLTKCSTNVNSFKRLLDNESFLLENKLYYDQY